MHNDNAKCTMQKCNNATMQNVTSPNALAARRPAPA